MNSVHPSYRGKVRKNTVGNRDLRVRLSLTN